MATPKQAARRLEKEHYKLGLSWREMSRSYGIPHRTLEKIVRTHGDYWPRKWAMRLAELFGVRPTQRKSKRTYEKLSDMPASVLAWKLLHREVIQ